MSSRSPRSSSFAWLPAPRPLTCRSRRGSCSAPASSAFSRGLGPPFQHGRCGEARGYQPPDQRGRDMAQISDPQKLFQHELGMALGAEKKVLTTLRKLEKRAQRDQLKQQFHHHLEETQGQIKNLEQAFEALGASAGAHDA